MLRHQSTGCRLPLVTCQRLFRVSNLGAHDIRRVVSGRVTPPTHLFDCLEHATKLCMFLEHATKLCISCHAAVPKALLDCLPNVRVPNLDVQDLASVLFHVLDFCVCHYFVALLVARPRRGACHAVTEGRAPRGRRCPRRTGRAICRARRRRVAASVAGLARTISDVVHAVGAVVAGSTRVGFRALQYPEKENSVFVD